MNDNVAAAVEVAARLGLRVDEPVVLRDLGSTLIRLDPSPVIARAWLTGRRPRAVVEHELLVTTYLASRGAPVAAPYGEPVAHEAGEAGDRSVTLWQLVDHDEERPVDGVAAGRALRTIHDLLADPSAPDFTGLPHFVRLEEVTEVVAALDGAGQDHADLEEMVALASQAVDRIELPDQPLHGDAWLGNVLRTPEGPVWSDFEMVCRGPREVDLSANETVARHRGRRPGDDDFLLGYGEVDWELVEVLQPLALVPYAAWTFRLAQERPEFLEAARWRLGQALIGLRQSRFTA